MGDELFYGMGDDRQAVQRQGAVGKSWIVAYFIQNELLDLFGEGKVLGLLQRAKFDLQIQKSLEVPHEFIQLVGIFFVAKSVAILLDRFSLSLLPVGAKLLFGDGLFDLFAHHPLATFDSAPVAIADFAKSHVLGVVLEDMLLFVLFVEGFEVALGFARREHKFLFDLEHRLSFERSFFIIHHLFCINSG